MRKFARRHFIEGALGLGGLLLGTNGRAWSQVTGAIRIGVAIPLSGPVAIIGNDIRLGAEIARDLVNKSGGVNGRSVELVFADSKGVPNDNLAAMRELLADGVTLLIGGTVSTEALAAVPIVESAKAMLITCGANAAAVTHERFSRRIFRGTNNDAENINAQLRLAVEKYPDVLEWAVVEIDNATMISAGEIFERKLSEAYAKIGKTANFASPFYLKMGTGDFRNQIATLLSSPVEGLYMQVYSQDAVTFYQQARSFGLAKKIKVILDRGNEVTFAKAMKKNVPENFWTLSFWNPELYKDVEMSRQIYDAYVAKTGDKMPPGFLHGGILGVLTYARAIAAAGGSTDPDLLIPVLEGKLVVQTEIGPVYYRSGDHQAVAPVSYVKFGPTDSEYGFKVYDGVRYDGATLLEEPAPGVPYKG